MQKSTLYSSNKFFFLAALLLIFITFRVNAQNEVTAFTITHTSGGEVVTKPHRNITLSLFIKNNMSRSSDCVSELTVPDSFRIIIPPKPFTLASLESHLVLASIFVPRGVKAGLYYIIYKVSDKTRPAVTEYLNIPVRVSASYHIVVEHVKAPKYVIAGDDFTSIFTIMNHGNTGARIELQIYCMDELPFTVEPLGEIRTISLPSAGSEQVMITVRTDIAMKKMLEHRLEVKAKVITDRDEEYQEDQVSDRAHSITDIVPRENGKAGLFHLLPVLLGVKGELYYNDLFGAESKFSLKSEGSIDENNVHNIKLRIEKVLSTDNNLFIHPSDFYFFRYWNPVFDVFLGDYTYYLSPLLETHTLGRGGGGSVLLGPFKIGAYYHRDFLSTLISIPDTAEQESIDHVAGYVDFIIPEPSFPEGFRYKASLNCYSTIYENIILGLRQKYKPFQFFDFDLEIASGLDFDESSSGYALYFESIGAYKWISYKLHGIYADPFFPGTYGDLYLVSGNLGFYFLENRLKFNTTYQQQQRNLSFDEEIPYAYSEKNALVNCSYSFGQDLTSFSLAWKYQNKEDTFPDPSYLFHDNGIHFTLFQPISQFALNFDWEFRYRFDTINDYNSYHHKYISSLDYTPELSTVYTFSLAYNGDYYSDKTDYHKLSASANYHYTINDFSLNAQLENVYALQNWGIRYFSLGLSCSLTYTLKKNQKLSMNSAYTISSTGQDAFLILEYKMPFSLPVSRKMSIGSVHGKIVDEKSGEGVEHVIVYLGSLVTVTDEKGNFAFNAVKPGSHYMNIDRSGMKKNYIPVADLPLKIEVEKGKQLDLVINLIEGARVGGQVILFQEDAGFGSLKKDESGNEEEMKSTGFPNILLELTGKNITMRRLSDKNGFFHFDEVLPGKWHLSVVSENYPEYHYIEKDTYDLDLTEGDFIELEFKILPEKRNISFIDTDDTLYIRPPDEDMVYDLEWKLEPEDLTPEPTPEPTPNPEETPGPEQTPEPTPGTTPNPEQTPESTPGPASQTEGPALSPTDFTSTTKGPVNEPTPLGEGTPGPLGEGTPESTPGPTEGPLPSPVRTAEPGSSITPVGTEHPMETITPFPSAYPTPTPLPTPSPELTTGPTPGPTESPVASPTPVPTPTPIVTPAPSKTPGATPSPVKTPVPSATPIKDFEEVPDPRETLAPEDIPPPRKTMVP